MTEYTPLDVVGSGSFGVIRKIKRNSDGKLLVRKEIDFRKMNDREKKQLVNEVNILRELRHPNIVRYYERIVDRETCMIYIIMEYCEGGDLAAVIRRCRKEARWIPEHLIWSLFVQLLQALAECHSGGVGKRMILHRDIKPDNVFLDGEQNVKLGDFGLSRIMDEEEDKGFTEEFGVTDGGLDVQRRFAKTFVGTPFYMSPELIDERGYDARSDIWSLGCLLYELAALEPPFQASTQAGLNAKIRSGRFPDLPPQYSQDLTTMVKMMLKVDPTKRPTCTDLLENPRVRIALKELQLSQREVALQKREEALKLKEEALAQREALLTTSLSNPLTPSRQPLSKISPNSVRLNRVKEMSDSTPVKSLIPSHPNTPLSTLAGKMKTLSIQTPGKPVEQKSRGSLSSTTKWLGTTSTPSRYKSVKPFQSPMQTSP